ncbi:tRNA (adenosine(37)-N6)-threonylcarbamoyltransferase complex dimerization subunit type 1 TsaB [Brevundimonas sp. NPDC092305]|uniref:tRNA (adenosine(37)-N6)-threonylcarbamoyltransferase complex dimerization subunit type 1 TsaB n=1 Tax=Brevundimonas sp. NPDC092305 TaxID=3363957 RepID=UPI0038097411
MKVLVIDTALGLCTAGVFEVTDGQSRKLGLRSEAMTKGHQERLGGLAREAVEAAGGFDSIDRIGVTVGPGSFTGLRVGLAFSQGLGAALDRPVIGVSTLDALAAGGASGTIAALIDARRGQVYARFWRDGAPLGEAEALSLEAAADAVEALGEDAVLVGSGAALIATGRPVVDKAGPDPEAIALLTAVADPSLANARPLYLRAPDATPPTRLPGQPRPVAAR